MSHVLESLVVAADVVVIVVLFVVSCLYRCGPLICPQKVA